MYPFLNLIHSWYVVWCIQDPRRYYCWLGVCTLSVALVHIVFQAGIAIDIKADIRLLSKIREYTREYSFLIQSYWTKT